MFTGIIETTAKVQTIEKHGSNISFWITSQITAELKVDQSVSHNGVCLTVEETRGDSYKVTAIAETLAKTNLGSLVPGSLVNLERCIMLGGRLDGHIVQGHVDTVAECMSIEEKEGSWEFAFSIPDKFAALIIEKGSISLNGISLTIFDVGTRGFKVAIIPFTYTHTNIQQLRKGDLVNIEFDMVGKYIQRISGLQRSEAG
jgi:riboflavin synthase